MPPQVRSPWLPGLHFLHGGAVACQGPGMGGISLSHCPRGPGSPPRQRLRQVDVSPCPGAADQGAESYGKSEQLMGSSPRFAGRHVDILPGCESEVGATAARKRGSAHVGEDTGDLRLMGNCGESLPKLGAPATCIPVCALGSLPFKDEAGERTETTLRPTLWPSWGSAPSTLRTSFLHWSWVLTSNFREGLHCLLPSPPVNPSCQDVSSWGSSHLQGKVGAHAPCCSSGLVVGSQAR